MSSFRGARQDKLIIIVTYLSLCFDFTERIKLRATVNLLLSCIQFSFEYEFRELPHGRLLITRLRILLMFSYFKLFSEVLHSCIDVLLSGHILHEEFRLSWWLLRVIWEFLYSLWLLVLFLATILRIVRWRARCSQERLLLIWIGSLCFWLWSGFDTVSEEVKRSIRLLWGRINVFTGRWCRFLLLIRVCIGRLSCVRLEVEILMIDGF